MLENQKSNRLTSPSCKKRESVKVYVSSTFFSVSVCFVLFYFFDFYFYFGNHSKVCEKISTLCLAVQIPCSVFSKSNLRNNFPLRYILVKTLKSQPN